MNLYDFDNTIYDGESSIDFYYYILTKNIKLIKYIPITLYALILYKNGKLSLEKTLEIANKYAKVIAKHQDEVEELVSNFWKKNSHKLKKKFLNRITNKDIIITASPKILLEGIKEKINTDKIICSELNMKTGKLEYLCMGKNKLKALEKYYPDIEIDKFFTDSTKNDKPLIELAKSPYLVKGKKLKRINKHHN